MKAYGSLLFLINFSIFAYQPDSVLCYKMDSVFSISKNSTWAVLANQSPKVYFAASFQTLQFDFEKSKQSIIDIPHFVGFFGDIAERINDSTTNAKFGTYYFSIETMFARNWFLLDCDSVSMNEDSSELVIFFHQNENSKLNEKYRKTRKKWINVENAGLSCGWFFRKEGNSKTRVGYFMMTRPLISIPDWLYNIAAKSMLPNTVNNVEKNILNELRKRT